MRCNVVVALYILVPFGLLFAEVPQVKGISVSSAKPGEAFEVTGVGLSADKVAEIYLTDQKFDLKVKILEQSDKIVKIRVPTFAKPGRVQLLLLTAGAEPKLLEEPVYLVIEPKQQ